MKTTKPRLGIYQASNVRPFNREIAQNTGRMLREHRERRGMSLRDVSGQTWIDEHYLEAIENGELQCVPQGLYIRSFLQKYAKCVDCHIDIKQFWAGLYSESYSDAGISPKSVPYSNEESNVVSLSPPKFATYFLYLFLTKGERVYLVGDLEEEFFEVVAKFGRLRARIWFYKQVMSSLAPLLWRTITKVRLIVSLVEIYSRYLAK